MSQELAGKIALVAGGSRGIGRAVAQRMAAAGAIVTLTYVSDEKQAGEVVSAIERVGGRASASQVDSSQGAAVDGLFASLKERFGRIDIVVNVAGASIFRPLADYADEDLEKMIALNVRGAFYVLRAAARHVADGGRIVHLSTGGTVTPMAAGGVYAGTKAAGERIALSLAKELGVRQITVNAISPGLTETDGLIMPQQALDQLTQQTPLGRLGQPDDIAGAILALVGPEGGWINGQNIQVNGGLQ